MSAEPENEVSKSLRDSQTISPTITVDEFEDKIQEFNQKGDEGHWRGKIVLVLVGLPARGKSYIAYKTVTYLRWRGFKADLFNVGKFRRQKATSPQDQQFFDSSNASAKAQREELAEAVLEQLLDWLEEGGDAAVFDATNTTNERRAKVMKICKRRSPLLNVVFVESVCDNPKVLEANYKEKATHSPDYKDMPLEEALKDLIKRVKNYEKVYEPINDDFTSYIKLIDLSAKVICNKVYGAMAHSIASFLMSIHIQPRPIYLARCGHVKGGDEINAYTKRDSLTNSQLTRNSDGPHIPYTLPLDSRLDSRGQTFAVLLKEFLTQKCQTYWKEHNELWDYIQNYLQIKDIDEHKPQMNQTTRLPLVVYTSTLARAQETAKPLLQYAQFVEQHSSLNMLDMGDLHGMTTDQIRDRHPNILKEWAKDRYSFRWPGGESQQDKTRTLIPLVMELERQRFPAVVLSHASTLQILYGYFMGMSVPQSQYYALNVPQEVVIELTPSQYGWIEKRYDFSSQVVERLRTRERSSSQPQTLAERTLGIQHYTEE
eukprot:TRINITY_DN6296_c0_g1_i1.p1 TRINITY_DN6296_c0_g1~~TRINITY_DN6296_c0_g1_i1.p1  ORF type:complete len:543 (-),score=157.61 TRINITY_DN6296_c0_g1_i1:30-1658(-)